MLPEVSTLLSAAEAGEPARTFEMWNFQMQIMSDIIFIVLLCYFKNTWDRLTSVKWISHFTSEEVCPGLLTPGWSWGLLTGAVRRGAGLPRTTVLGVSEVEETGAEASWGSWLCWMNAAESGVSCLKAGRLLCRRQTGGGTSNNNMHFKITFSLLWCTKKRRTFYWSLLEGMSMKMLPWGKAQGKVGVRSLALCTICWWIPQLPVCPPSTINRHKKLRVRAVKFTGANAVLPLLKRTVC